jgi:hypothetical protein
MGGEGRGGGGGEGEVGGGCRSSEVGHPFVSTHASLKTVHNLSMCACTISKANPQQVAED